MRRYHSLPREPPDFRTPSPVPIRPRKSIVNAYVLPKMKQMSFSVEQRPAEEKKPSLIQKINDLERNKRSDKSKIQELETQIADLKAEVDSLRSTNRALLEGDVANAGDVHALYQDLFITDMKNQMQELSNEAVSFRLQKEEGRIEIDSLRKTNAQLMSTVKRYRTMLQEALKKSAPKEIPENSSVMSAMNSESDISILKKSHLDTPKRSLLPSMKNTLLPSKKLEKLISAIEKLNSAKDIQEACRTTVKAAKSLVKCEKITLFFVDPEISDEYSKSFKKSIDFIAKTRVGNRWLFIHTDNEACQEVPVFSKIEDLKPSIREYNKLVFLVSNNGKPALILQCQEKISKKKVFTHNDELLLKLLGQVVGQAAQSLILKKEINKEILQGSQVFEVANSIASAMSHKDIANKARAMLPAVTGFESVGIVFVDPYSSHFFVMIHDENSEEFYSENITRYPNKIGITGETYASKQAKFIENPRVYAYYNPEIDNIAFCQDVKNIYMRPVFDSKQNIVAVLQCLNKVYDVDHDRFEKIVQMVGCSVNAGTVIIELRNMLVQIRGSMNSLMTLLKTSQKWKGDEELGVILNSMYKIDSQVKKMKKAHKSLINAFK